MRKEIEICTLLRQQVPDFPCAVPRMLSETFCIQECLPGAPYLAQKWTSAEKQAIAEQLVTLLGRLRQVRPGTGEGPTPDDWRSALQQKAREAIRQMLPLRLTDEALLLALEEWIGRTLANARIPGPLSLVHNDLNKENILIDRAEGELRVSLIDFERAVIGDPFKEVSKLIWLFRADGELGGRFRESYERCFGAQDRTLLKVYWCLDMLGHLAQYEVLKASEGWAGYLAEEIGILQNVMKEEFRIW